MRINKGLLKYFFIVLIFIAVLLLINSPSTTGKISFLALFKSSTSTSTTITNPTDNFLIKKDSTFNLTAVISCNNTFWTCKSVKLTISFSPSDSFTLVSGDNTKGVGSIKAGRTKTVSWLVKSNYLGNHIIKATTASKNALGSEDSITVIVYSPACNSDLDCGTSGYVSVNYCGGDGNVYRNYRTFKCENAGTINASCSDSTTAILQQNCTDSCANGTCIEITLSDAEIWQRLRKYQAEIQANNDIFPPTNVDGFVSKKGKRNVLLSAPHATRHVREGATQPSDLCTAPIIRVLQDLTNVSVIYTNYKSKFDPNYYDYVTYNNLTYVPHPYKENMKSLALGAGFVVILDIHGSAAARGFDLDIGTMDGKSLLGKSTLLSSLEESFKSQGITNLSYNFFSAEEQQTVTKYSALKLNISAIQLEINRNYRNCSGSSTAIPQDTIRLVRALEKYIRTVTTV